MTISAPGAPHPSSDASITARARALVEAGTTELAPAVLRVPLEYYRSPAHLAIERERLRHTPLGVTMSIRIPDPHDFLVRDVLGTSVLVTRDGDGVVHAFLNYCRHRGARPAAGCGNARRHTCPYHAWNYDSAGQLVGMPGQEGFAEIDRSQYGLVELPCEERHGIVWTVLTVGDPIDVAAHLGPLDDELGGWHFDGHEHVAEEVFDAEVNWKAAHEAFAESYHFPYVHGSSIIGQNTVPNTAVYETFGRHHRVGFPSPWIVDLPEGTPPLHGVSFIYWIYPHLVLAVNIAGVEIIDILPGTDPVSCTVVHGFMAKEPAGGDEETMAGYRNLFDVVHAALVDEDFAMLPSCAAGIRNGQHAHQLIGRNEPAVQNVVRQFAADLHLSVD